MLARSYLFVPATRTDRIAKAQASGADEVIVDLEDAVAAVEKDAARQSLSEWLSSTQASSCILRINAIGTAWFERDAEVCAHPKIKALVLPKAESADQMQELAALLPGKPCLPLIESAQGFVAAQSIAQCANVHRLLFGSLDFQADMGIEGDDEELLYFRSQLVLISRLAGRAPPVDGVTTALHDPDRVRSEALRAKRLGFGGKLCIHPSQIQAVHLAFSPSTAERDWATRILAAIEASAGAAVAVDGQMVDAPVVKRAQQILERCAG